MFKKSLYVAAALISFAFIAPAHAQEFEHDSGANRHNGRLVKQDKFARHNEFENRHEERDHYVELRDDRRYYHDDYRHDDHHHHHHHHHDYHDHHAYYDELHLMHHLVVVLASR